MRRALGRKLRVLRLKAGKSLADVEVAGLGSRAKISKVENGQVPVKLADVLAWCDLYGAAPATRQTLAELVPGTKQDGWREEYGDVVVPEWFGLYAELEERAARIDEFSAHVVPGLLQTVEYARLVIGEDDQRLAPEVVDRRVSFRMERQRSVLGAYPAATFVMAETAVRFGPPEILEPQVAHLRALAAEPRLDVRVLPFSCGTYPRRGSFTLLYFDDPDDPSVAYIEVPKGARYFDTVDTVEEHGEYEYVFDIICGKSIPIEEWEPA